ncbi:MAG: class I SAM-dependent methyltransferase [Bacteroidia bacterium]
MKQKASVIDCYDKSAQAYADQFMDELAGKSLDRLLLSRFAEQNQEKGLMLDLACGPGQTTSFLQSHGVKHLLGVDLSPEMVAVAQKYHQGSLDFVAGDILALPLENASAGSAICFYGIVHFNDEELGIALREIHRVLKSGAEFLFSFHIGDEALQVTDFLGHEVEIAFQYFEIEQVKQLALDSGWQIKEVIERHPYEGVEYPSKRAYFLLEKN